MTHESTLLLYYAPRTRAFTALWLLEELGQPYRLESFGLSSGRHREPEFLAMNPMGKVPLLVDGGIPVAETAAIAMYLADRFPEAGLAPPTTSSARAQYLRWCVFGPGVIEPALNSKFFGWEAEPSTVAYGSFERMLETAAWGLREGPWLLGAEFSAADIVTGAALRFAAQFGALPAEAQDGPIGAYVARLDARPALRRALEIEARELEALNVEAASA